MSIVLSGFSTVIFPKFFSPVLKIIDKSPTTPIGRGLMKTPRRGLKASLCKVFEKKQIFYFYNSRFKILILRHSCSQKNNFRIKQFAVSISKTNGIYAIVFREPVKGSATENNDTFLYLHNN